MINMTPKIKTRDQRGLVSFMITLIMMMVISLIVIGFTQVANRNRRESLDRQLSTQAFYAAESGVNDVIGVMKADIAAGHAPQSQNSCTSGYYSTHLNRQLSSSPDVAYTCVLAKPVVPDLQTAVTTDKSTVLHIQPVDASGGAVTSAGDFNLTFTWSVATAISPTCGSSLGVFTTNALYNCGFGLLRLDMMQVMPASPTSAPGLNTNTATFFIQPVSSGASAFGFSSFQAGAKANIVSANCSVGLKSCKATLRLSSSAKAPLDYYARLTMLYRDTPLVVIDGQDVATGADAYFANQQAMIDVTGRADDVLKRVQVRADLDARDTTNLPLGSIQSQGPVCKRFIDYPGVNKYSNVGCP